MWSQGNERGSICFNPLLETMPNTRADGGDFTGGIPEQIEDNPRQIAIAEQQIGGFEGLLGAAAAHPEQLGAEMWGERTGIKLVPPVDECEFGNETGHRFLFEQ